MSMLCITLTVHCRTKDYAGLLKICNDFALNNPIPVSASPITTSDDDTFQTYLSFTLLSASSLREFHKGRLRLYTKVFT